MPVGPRRVGERLSAGCRGNIREWRDETVAAPRQRFNEARRRRRIAQRRPDLRDAVIQSVLEVDEGLAAPYRLLELGPRDHLAGALNQVGKHACRLRLEAHDRAAAPQLARCRVEFELPELHRW